MGRSLTFDVFRLIPRMQITIVSRVKELRDQAETAQREAEAREAEQRARFESLQAKVAEQVPYRFKIIAAKSRISK